MHDLFSQRSQGLSVMQVTSTENKLSTLYEYVDDTEDYVEIQQDNRRNQLIKLDLLVGALCALHCTTQPVCAAKCLAATGLTDDACCKQMQGTTRLTALSGAR